MYQIVFRNADQVTLFECELKGQISDGKWENASPRNHYFNPCEAEITAEGEKLGPNFIPRRHYNFCSPDLLETIRYRMLWWVKAKRAFPGLPLEKHWDWDFSDGVESEYEKNKWQKFGPLFFEGLTFAEAVGRVDSTPYSIQDLRKDLRDMSAIFNGRITDRSQTLDMPRKKDKKKELLPRVKLTGRDGNALAILGACVREAKAAGKTPEWINAFVAEATAGDYNHLLATAQKYFDVN